MLFIVLILVLAALALLVTALITANSLWAWVSIALSVLAAVVLVVDFFRRRAQRKREERAAEASADPVTKADDEEGEAPETTAAEVSGDADVPGDPEAGEQAAPPESGDPAVEQTSPGDAEVVAQLDVEVVVVDEYPRYHVTECEWLSARETIPLAVKEARELGFTPCARCTPDAKLAEAHRAAAR